MGILTPREKEILRYLRQGKSVKDIGKLVGTPITSISRSITSVRRKAQDIEEDVQFFCEIGYASIEKGRLKFLTANRDPKALSKNERSQLARRPLLEAGKEEPRGPRIIDVMAEGYGVRRRWRRSANHVALARNSSTVPCSAAADLSCPQRLDSAHDVSS